MKLVGLSIQPFTSGSPQDLAKELGFDGKMAILRVICRAYKNLYKIGKITSTSSETEITEELYIELQIEWKGANIPLIPIHEKSHGKKNEGRGKTPTIDFCFRGRWNPNSYFGAECKLLNINDNKLYKKYIENGMYRYISGKYSEKCSTGMMIGYIVIGNTNEIIPELNNRINKLPNISNINKSYDIDDFIDHYESIHEREFGISPFNMHHLFFCFT